MNYTIAKERFGVVQRCENKTGLCAFNIVLNNDAEIQISQNLNKSFDALAICGSTGGHMWIRILDGVGDKPIIKLLDALS